jgi:hypothetical protein
MRIGEIRKFFSCSPKARAWCRLRHCAVHEST